MVYNLKLHTFVSRTEAANGGRPATLFKKRLWRKCFPVNFAKFLRTTFLQNTSGRLTLKKSKYLLCKSTKPNSKVWHFRNTLGKCFRIESELGLSPFSKHVRFLSNLCKCYFPQKS